MKKYQKKGLSLLEVLTVVVIIGILTTISYPSWNYIIRKTRSNEAKVNLAFVAVSLHNYKAHCRSFYPDFQTIGAVPTGELHYNLRLKHDSSETWKTCFHDDPQPCTDCKVGFNQVCGSQSDFDQHSTNTTCTLKSDYQVNNFDVDVIDKYISQCHGSWATNKTITSDRFCLFAASSLSKNQNDETSYNVWMINDDKIIQEVQVGN